MHTLFKKFLCSAAALMVPAAGFTQDTEPAAAPAPSPSSGASLSGVVFQDENEDGRMQETEFAAIGVIVDLLDAEGNFIVRVLTEEDGIYNFENLAGGIYFLRFEFSPGFGVRSRGIEIGSADFVFIPVPVIHPDSRYSFTRLQLTNPANFKGEEVSPYSP